jgi:hypothetical protein
MAGHAALLTIRRSSAMGDLPASDHLSLRNPQFQFGRDTNLLSEHIGSNDTRPMKTGTTQWNDYPGQCSTSPRLSFRRSILSSFLGRPAVVFAVVPNARSNRRRMNLDSPERASWRSSHSIEPLQPN